MDRSELVRHDLASMARADRIAAVYARGLIERFGQ